MGIFGRITKIRMEFLDTFCISTTIDSDSQGLFVVLVEIALLQETIFRYEEK